MTEKVPPKESVKKAPRKKEPREKKEVPQKEEKTSESSGESKEKKAPPSADDIKRYEGYVGKTWKGKCRWFNVMKGFGFIDPENEESKEHKDDVFVHQSVLVMPGFRSLDEGEEVEFEVSLGRNGLEATNVRGVDGAELRGHSIRPLGKKKDKMIRCFKCGLLGFHRATKCKKDLPAKACYNCHSADHLVGDCPDYPKKKGEKPAQVEAQ